MAVFGTQHMLVRVVLIVCARSMPIAFCTDIASFVRLPVRHISTKKLSLLQTTDTFMLVRWWGIGYSVSMLLRLNKATRDELMGTNTILTARESYVYVRECEQKKTNTANIIITQTSEHRFILSCVDFQQQYSNRIPQLLHPRTSGRKHAYGL